ncbi:hypothetical protein M9458_050357 [Cirrhinus mrigala]|uniref:Uncharacterized protein n=1 Tax=Cirrhinus mrigala TaxID=683832 RepID=A0ABD0MWF9_CIRMR
MAMKLDKTMTKKQNRGKQNKAMKSGKTLGRVRTSKTILREACLVWASLNGHQTGSNPRSSRGSGNRESMGEGSLCWRGVTESPPLGVTPGTQNNNNSPGGWGNRGKTGGGTGDQVRAEEVGLDRGAGTDSEALEDLGHGTVADRETLEDLGHGTVADRETLEDLGHGTVVDSGTLEGLGHGAVADSGNLEDLGRGEMADGVTLEQKSTMFDSEEPGAMVGRAGREGSHSRKPW